MVDVRVPFGGYKQSGIGRDLGEYAIQQYVIEFLSFSADFPDTFLLLFH